MTPKLETRAAEAMARASQAGRLRVPVARDSGQAEPVNRATPATENLEDE